VNQLGVGPKPALTADAVAALPPKQLHQHF
jgi:hypothetical protein